MGGTRRRFSWVAAVAVILGCSSGCDDGGDPDAGTVDDGGSADAGPGGEAVEVSFLVRDTPTLEPIMGSTVTFDAPGGDRQEATSGADGRVTFMAVWERGEASVTWTRDQRLFSITRLTQARAPAVSNAAGDIVLSSRPARPSGAMVTVTGTFTNVTSATNRFNVIPNVRPATIYNDVGPDFTVEVPAGVPFRLFGLEYSGTRTSPIEITQSLIGAQFQESPALSADGTIDFDLATSLAYSESTGSIPLPTGRLEGAGVYGVLTTSESGYSEFLGSMTTSAPNAADATQLDFTMGAFAVPGVDAVLGNFISSRGNVGAFVRVMGIPSGAQPSFPNPPTVTNPVLGTPYPLHDPITIDGVDADMFPYFFLTDATDDNRELWSVLNLEMGDTEIVIPTPPAASPISSLLPAGNELVGRSASCELDDDAGYCQRFAFGDQVFDLTP